MKTWQKVLLGAAGAIGAWYLIGEGYHESQKASVFCEARARADELGLPLLNLGCSCYLGETVGLGKEVSCMRNYATDNSDINADIVPRNVPRFVLLQTSPYRIPLPDKSVVTYCSHVLEHCPNYKEVLKEIERVGVEKYIITPTPFHLGTWLHPDHKWVFI